MQSLSLILALSIALIIGFFLARFILQLFVERKALAKLEPVLFPEGARQKTKIAEALNIITKERFNEEQILDYFIKIKGLQVTDLSDRSNFWIKKFLFRPTLIKLNYFEQVEFYKMFLNYPATMESSVQKNQDSASLIPWQKGHFRYPSPCLGRSMA